MNKLKFILLVLTGSFFWSVYLSSAVSYDVQSKPQVKEVNILTLNTALLTVFFETINVNLKDNNKRAALIGKTIKTMSPQPDIVVFQEAFDNKALRKILYKEIKDIYPHAIFDGRTNAYFGGGVGSGLALLSKYPISRKMQKDYNCWAGIEALARKGIMGAELTIDGCPFYMFTSHLQAGVSKRPYVGWTGKARDWFAKLRGKEPRICEGKKISSLNSDQIRSIELRQAKKDIDSFIVHKNAPVVFAGDFNISRTRDAEFYDELFRTFPGADDTYVHGSQKIKSSAWHDGKVADTETDRLDYVLLLNPSSNITGLSNIIQNFTYQMTDHLGTLATVKFSCD